MCPLQSQIPLKTYDTYDICSIKSETKEMTFNQNGDVSEVLHKVKNTNYLQNVEYLSIMSASCVFYLKPNVSFN